MFSLLEKKQQAILIQEINYVKFKKGSTIASKGEQSSNMYLINKGSVACDINYQRKPLLKSESHIPGVKDESLSFKE